MFDYDGNQMKQRRIRSPQDSLAQIFATLFHVEDNVELECTSAVLQRSSNQKKQ
jgi:hypothetical protein